MREVNAPSSRRKSKWAEIRSRSLPTRAAKKAEPAQFMGNRKKTRQELRDQALSQVTSQKEHDIKTTWEQQTDKRIQINRVKRVVGEFQRQQEHTLEERKEKLRELLWKEEDQWFREMERQQETVEDRQQAMREKLERYKSAREEERKEIVARKLDQQFSNNCEEVTIIQV